MNVRRSRVLVVEDQDIIRHMVAESLVDAGFEVVETEDGDRALILLIDMGSLDVLVTDIQSPARRTATSSRRQPAAIIRDYRSST